MQPDADYKPILSVSIPPDRRPIFYTSLAQFLQHYPFITNSGLVVQAVIDVTQMGPQLIEIFALLSQEVQIIPPGSGYFWKRLVDQGSAPTFLEAVSQVLTALPGALPSSEKDQPIVSSAGTEHRNGWP